MSVSFWNAEIPKHYWVPAIGFLALIALSWALPDRPPPPPQYPQQIWGGQGAPPLFDQICTAALAGRNPDDWDCGAPAILESADKATITIGENTVLMPLEYKMLANHWPVHLVRQGGVWVVQCEQTTGMHCE